MSEETVRCWLVERDFWDEDLVTLVYATPDGKRYYQRQLAGDLLVSIDVTAARNVPATDLEPTPEADRDRYATEARRMMESHDPDDVI